MSENVDLTHRPRVINAAFIDQHPEPIFRVMGGEVYETGDGKILNCIQIEAEDGHDYLYNPNATALKLLNKINLFETSKMVNYIIVFYTVAVEVAGKAQRGVRIDKILNPRKEILYEQEHEKKQKQTSLKPEESEEPEEPEPPEEPEQKEQTCLDPE